MWQQDLGIGFYRFIYTFPGRNQYFVKILKKANSALLLCLMLLNLHWVSGNLWLRSKQSLSEQLV